MEELNWDAIGATDWRDPEIKEGKQAEFLVEASLPWELVEVIAVMSNQIAEHVTDVIRLAHPPA